VFDKEGRDEDRTKKISKTEVYFGDLNLLNLWANGALKYKK